MQTATATIHAASYNQAMDWSLVLTSQGIENTVEALDTGEWVVSIPQESATLAAASIHAYEQENTISWRHEVKWTGLLFDWRSLFWWILVAGITTVIWRTAPEIRQAGLMNGKLLLAGEWWRSVTAVTMHADIGHLAVNATTGMVFLGLVMGFYGPGVGLLLALLSGVAANAAESIIRVDGYTGLGASGMVLGSLGLLAGQSMFEWNHSPREWFARGLLAATLLLFLVGLDTKSDVLAHVLGFVAGVILGVPFCFLSRRLKKVRWLDLACVFLSGGIVIAAWSAAFRAAAQ